MPDISKLILLKVFFSTNAMFLFRSLFGLNFKAIRTLDLIKWGWKRSCEERFWNDKKVAAFFNKIVITTNGFNIFVSPEHFDQQKPLYQLVIICWSYNSLYRL